jgi:glyoxylase-like metal-dependent hydrolase (beta-lactamase superfamily II)
LSYWLAPHPEWEQHENWPEEVVCARYESADGLVLVDPQLWPDKDDTFLELGGRTPLVLLTSPWHDRDTSVFVERYGSPVWAPPRALWKGPNPSSTDRVPRGVEVYEPAGDDNQALFFFRGQRTLFTGDVFSGTGGRFHVFFDEEQPREPFLDSLEPLTQLPIECVLIAHGESIFEHGAQRIGEALEEARP